LLAGSDDHSICVYDLSMQNELDSVDLILSPEWPLDYLRFKSNNDIVFQCSDNLMGEFDFEKGMKKYSYMFMNSVN